MQLHNHLFLCVMNIVRLHNAFRAPCCTIWLWYGILLCVAHLPSGRMRHTAGQDGWMKRTTIFLGEADRTAIQAIKDRFGISSDSDAIRLALRVIAGVPNPQLLLLPRAETPPVEEQEHAA